MYCIITTCSVECYWHCSDGAVYYTYDEKVFCGFRCANTSPITVLWTSFSHLFIKRMTVGNWAYLADDPFHLSAPNLAQRIFSPTWSPMTFFGNQLSDFDFTKDRILLFCYLQTVAIRTVLAVQRSQWDSNNCIEVIYCHLLQHEM